MRTESVIHSIDESIRRFPSRDALETPGGTWDYATLNAHACGLQRALQARGLPGNRMIGVLTGDHPLCYASILAVLACGCAYVPISHRNPRDRIAAVLEDAALELVLAHRDLEQLAMACETVSECQLLRTDEVQSSAGTRLELPEVGPDDLAYLLYTSGSTGSPKGVPIRHRNLNAFMSVMLNEQLYDFSEQDRFLQMFDLTFDASVPAFLVPLCIGACSCIIAEQGIVSLTVVQALQNRDISVAVLVPSVLFYVQRYFNEISLGNVRFSLFVGEALPESVASQWQQCVPSAIVQNLYGPTEATVVCFCYELCGSIPEEDTENGIVSLGKPFAGTTAFIVDSNGSEVAPGTRGELCISGPQVTDRYWRSDERTKAAFFVPEGMSELAYRTGDICYLNELGNYIYCGRADHQVKIDGYRVELGEIEHHARDAADGVNVAVVATAAADGSAKLTLFLEDPAVDDDTVLLRLRSKLPPHMLPGRVRAVSDMPLNVNGKIDRRALTCMADAGSQPVEPGAAGAG